MEIFFATSNPNKVREFQSILGEKWKVRSNLDFEHLKEVSEPFETLEENSMHKAKEFYSMTGIACVAEDTGLEVAFLSNAPGVRSARYAGEERSDEKNISLVLSQLDQAAPREARFRTVITYYDGEAVEQFEGIVEGRIGTQAVGTSGFGYDPIFIPHGYTQTFAQMDLKEKNAISHRAKAVAALMHFLNDKTME